MQRRFDTPMPGNVTTRTSMPGYHLLLSRDGSHDGGPDLDHRRTLQKQMAARSLLLMTFDPRVTLAAVADENQTVRVDGQRYGVTRTCVFSSVTVKWFADRVTSLHRCPAVAEHHQVVAYDDRDTPQPILDSLHDLSTLQRKSWL